MMSILALLCASRVFQASCVQLDDRNIETSVPWSPQASAVLVEGLTEGETHAFVSSGFFVDADGTLVTIRHGVEGMQAIWVNAGPRGKWDIKEVLLDRPDIDVVVFRVDVKPHAVEPLRLATLTPAKGDRCYVLGMADSGEGTRAAGDYLDQNATREDCRRQINRECHVGESGAPVVNEGGEVVGMLVRASGQQGALIGAPAIQDCIRASKARSPTPVGKWLSHEREPQIRKSVEKIRAGIDARKSKKYDESIGLLKAAFALDPANPRSIDELRYSLTEANREGELLAVLEYAASQNPTERCFRLWIGELKSRQGFQAEAEAIFRRAFEQEPTLASGISLGYVLGRQEKYAEAIALLTKLNTDHPEHLGPLDMLEWILRRADDDESLLATWEKAVKLCPTDVVKLYDVCIAEARAGRLEKLEETYGSLKTKSPTSATRLLAVLSELELPVPRDAPKP